MNINLVKQAQQAIHLGGAMQSRLTPEILKMEGMSSAKVRHLLNNVTAFPGCRYLEIGVWKGSTLISAVYGHAIDYIAIDNWSGFGGPRHEFANNFRQIIGSEPNIIDADCFSFDPAAAGITDMNVYFYDGSHEKGDHRRAVLHYLPAMAGTFIFLVDDWSVKSREIETRDALEESKATILFQQALPGWFNSRKLWWSGVWVAVIKK